MAQTLAANSSSSSLESISIPVYPGHVSGPQQRGVTTVATAAGASSSSGSSFSHPVPGHMHPLTLCSAVRAQDQFDEIIEELDSNSSSNGQSPADPVDMGDVADYPSNEPIVIRGNGNITLFGLSNTFNSDFPCVLVGKVSREEFEATLTKINTMLRQHHSTNAKLLLLGCLCCCCSFGCSLLWPTLALSKRTRTALEKLIASENHRLYHKLGLNWKLSKERCHTNYAFMEYVLVIEFLPKLHLYQPD